MKIRDKMEERRLKKMAKDIEKIAMNDYAYNPYASYIPQTLMDAGRISQNIGENLCWYIGDPYTLSQFFSQTNNDNYKNYFWGLRNARKVHSGVPALISGTMATLIFANGYNKKITIYKKDENGKPTEIDEEQSDKAAELLDIVLNEIKEREKELNGAEAESWSGHIAFKMSYDINLSPLPIVEVCDRRFFDVESNRGITTAIVFKHYYNNGNDKYVLDERYSTNEIGEATIEYTLKRKTGDKLVVVPLDTIKETSNLLASENGVLIDKTLVITFKDLKGMLAFDKPNLSQPTQWIDSPYGVSDYARSSSTFDALDEVVSGMVQELRENKTRRYIPQDMLPKDKDGKTMPLPEDMVNFMLTKEDLDYVKNGGKVGIIHESIMDKTEQHWLKYRMLITQACNQAGLNPISIGATGLESIASSDSSTRERTKITNETRNKKISLWSEFLEKYLLQLMIFTSYLQQNYPEQTKAGVPEIKIDYANADLKITFNDYIVNSKEEKLATISSAVNGGVMSIEQAIDELYGDEKSVDEKQQEINRLKYEKGMALDNPELMGLNGIVNG